MRDTYISAVGALVSLVSLGGCTSSAGPVGSTATITVPYAATPYAVSGSSPSVIPTGLSGKLRYFFAAAPKGEQKLPSPLNALDLSPTISPGSLYDTADIMAIMSNAAPKPAHPSLFGPADLYLNLFDANRDEDSIRLLATCQELDIYADRVDEEQQKAECDSKVYSISMDEEGLSLRVDDQIVQVYRLSPGAYALNGRPFLIR
jgi:hypothetical protein